MVVGTCTPPTSIACPYSNLVLRRLLRRLLRLQRTPSPTVSSLFIAFKPTAVKRLTLACSRASPKFVGPLSSSLWSVPVWDLPGFSFWSGWVSASSVWPGAPCENLSSCSSARCASSGMFAFCSPQYAKQHSQRARPYKGSRCGAGEGRKDTHERLLHGRVDLLRGGGRALRVGHRGRAVQLAVRRFRRGLLLLRGTRARQHVIIRDRGPSWEGLDRVRG